MDGEREKLIFNGSNVSYSAISGSSNQRMGYSNSRNKSTTLLPAANTGDMYVKDTSTKALMRKRVRSEADLLPSRRVNRLNHEWRRKLYVALPFTATFGMTSKEQRVKRSVSMDNSHMLDGEVLPQVIASMDAYESALTLPLLAAVVLSMISQFLVGYNTSVMNAPQNVVFPQHTTIEWSLAVSAFAIGGPFGAFFGGKLANVHGRKGALLLNAWVFLVGGLIMTLAQSIYWLIPGRFVVGFASGVSSVVVPIYLGEIAPPTLRGTLGTCTQFAMVIGILVSSLIAFPLATESCWRYLFLVTPALCVAQLLSAPFVVESPRWLLSKETEADEIDKDIKPTYTPKNPFDPQPTDDSKTPPNSHSHPPTPYLKGGAREVIRKLRGYRLDEEVDEEVRNFLTAAEVHRTDRGSAHSGGAMADLLQAREYRGLLIAAIGLQLAQQLCGINAVFYYSTSFFEGIIDNPLQGTCLVNFINVVATFVALQLMDTSHRRTLLLTSSLGMAFSALLLTAAALGIVHRSIALVAVMLFVSFFEIGLGPIPWLIVAEFFDAKYVATAMSLACMLNWSCNFLVGFLFPYIQQALGPYVFLPFAGVLVLTFVFVLCCVTETYGKSTEQVYREQVLLQQLHQLEADTDCENPTHPPFHSHDSDQLDELDRLIIPPFYSHDRDQLDELDRLIILSTEGSLSQDGNGTQMRVEGVEGGLNTC